jgi:hypothetical protein
MHICVVLQSKPSLLRNSKRFEIVHAVMKVLRRFSHHPKVDEDGGLMQGAHVPVDQAIRSSITMAWDPYSRSKPLINISSHLHAFHHCPSDFVIHTSSLKCR